MVTFQLRLLFRLSAAIQCFFFSILAAARLKLSGGESDGKWTGQCGSSQEHRIKGWDSEVGHTNKLS